MTGNLIVGQNGVGGFTQEGGAVTVGGDLILGQLTGDTTAGTGSYSMSASDTSSPTLDVTGNLIVGNEGFGDFTQEGGEVTVGGSLILANGDTHGGWDGVYSLYNGGLTVGQEGYPTAMTVGAGGRGLFVQYDGNLLVHGDLIVGDREGSVGTVDQYGGTARSPATSSWGTRGARMLHMAIITCLPM